MKPEDRKRLKQHIGMVLTGQLSELEEENKKLVEEYGKLSEMWQNEHAEKLTLIEKLKFAEERIKYLRATIMNEIEDDPIVDTESMMFQDKNGG